MALPAALLPAPLICIIVQTAHSEVLSVAIWVTVESHNVDMLDQYKVSSVADPGFGFMRMCTVATTPPFDAHAHKVAAAVLTASNSGADLDFL